MAESAQISYHVATSHSWFKNRSHIFVSGTRSARFESEKRPLSLLFLTSKKHFRCPSALNVLEFMYSLFFKNNCGSQLYSYEKQRVIIFQMKTLTLVRCQRLSQHNFYQRQLFLSLTPGERMSDYKVVTKSLLSNSLYLHSLQARSLKH